MSDWDRDWPAPAKINLFLHVVGRRADGYHQLQTVFRFLDYGDTLRCEPRSDDRIVLAAPLPGVPPETDLVVRAAQALRAATGIGAGVTLHLEKRLPMGGGLGGGSSDAATTLMALNRLWRTGLARPATHRARAGRRCACLHSWTCNVRRRSGRALHRCQPASGLVSGAGARRSGADAGNLLFAGVAPRYPGHCAGRLASRFRPQRPGSRGLCALSRGGASPGMVAAIRRCAHERVRCLLFRRVRRRVGGAQGIGRIARGYEGLRGGRNRSPPPAPDLTAGPKTPKMRVLSTCALMAESRSWGVAKLVKAPDFDSGMRRFESFLPSQNFH